MHYPMSSYEVDHHIGMYLVLVVNNAIFFYSNLSGNSLMFHFEGGFSVFF